MMSTPLVSVVIATKDRWPLLRRALADVASQRGVAVDLVVVDDGSTSSAPEDVRAAIARHGRLIPNDGAPGVAAARNLGLERARGDWVACLDDDDRWAPDWLRTAVDTAVEHEAGFVAGAHWVIDEEGMVIGAQAAPEAAAMTEMLRRGNVIGGPSMVVLATSEVRAAGGFDVRFSALADWELWLRMAGRTACATVHQPLVAYTVHGGNMHVRDPAGVRREAELLDGLGVLAPDARAGLERWMAEDASIHRRRRRGASGFLALARREHRAGDVVAAVRALTVGHRMPRASGVHRGPLPW